MSFELNIQAIQIKYSPFLTNSLLEMQDSLNLQTDF